MEGGWAHLKEFVRHVVLGTHPVVHDKYLVHVHDGVEAMRYGEHGAVLELGADDALDENVRVEVQRCRRLVHHQNLHIPFSHSAPLPQNICLLDPLCRCSQPNRLIQRLASRGHQAGSEGCG
jgi:hypothetical protein